MTAGAATKRGGSDNVPVESFYIPITFTNLGDDPCDFVGGTFDFVAADGKTVIGWGTGLGGGFFDLDAKAIVTTTLQVGITESYDPAICKGQPVSGIRVTPPSDPRTTIVPSPVDTGCVGNVAAPGTLVRSQMVATPITKK